MAEEMQVQNAAQDAGDDFDAAFDEATREDAAQAASAPAEEAQPAQQEEAAADVTVGQQGNMPPTEEGDVGDSKPDDDYRHKFDSAMGRLKASQQQNKELNEEIARLREKVASFDAGSDSGQKSEDGKAEQQDVPGLENVPEELKSLFREDSADGRRLRKMAEEFGADYAIPIAETIRERNEVRAWRKQAEQDRQTREETEHLSKVAAAVPEFADALVGADRSEKFTELLQGVNAWIDTLPYSQGVAMTRIVNEGTPDEVISMLKRYSRHRTGSRGQSVRNLARNNMAVPTNRNNAPPVHNYKDDFDSAFEEFSH